MELDVLAVGEVRGAAGELVGDVRDDPQLLGGELAAVDADAEHEVFVFELVRFEFRCAAAVDSGFALGVQAPPAEAAVQVVGGDRRESLLGIDGFDPGANVEAVVFGLVDLVFVQRFMAVDLPLPIGLLRAGRPLCGSFTCCFLVLFHLSGHCCLQTLRGTSDESRYMNAELLNNSPEVIVSWSDIWRHGLPVCCGCGQALSMSGAEAWGWVPA